MCSELRSVVVLRLVAARGDHPVVPDVGVLVADDDRRRHVDDLAFPEFLEFPEFGDQHLLVVAAGTVDDADRRVRVAVGQQDLAALLKVLPALAAPGL